MSEVAVYGNKDDVCAVDGCGTILRGANPYTVCQVHERVYRENTIALTERARRRNGEATVASPAPVPHGKSTSQHGPASRQLVVDAVARFAVGEPFGVSEIAKLAGRSDPVCRQVLAELAESGAVTMRDDKYPLRYMRTTSLPDPAPAPAPAEGLTHPAAGSDLVSDDGGQDSGPEPPPLTGDDFHGPTYRIVPFAGVVSNVEKVLPRDPELYALCRCAELLDELSPMARERVVHYLEERGGA